jgi:4-hydroxybenzoate polyprenyltransferase
MSALIRLIRPKHWVKNAFVGAPLFFTPDAVNAANVTSVALGILAFCAAASAVYILNDWCDREADRLHPAKRTRPIASRAVSGKAALGLAVALLAIAAAAATRLPALFGLLLAVYLLLNVAYSLRLKHVSLLDVMIVALGFVLRVEAGAAAVGIVPTVWIVVCTGLLALFLALAKRRDDLTAAMDAAHRRSLDGYNLRFVDAALAAVLGALLVSYLVYTTDVAAIRRYGTDRLYLTAPFVVAGVLRYLQVALVEERSGSPTDLALGDRFLLACVAGWVAVFAWLIYA